MPAGIYQHKPHQGFQKGNKLSPNKGRVFSEEWREKLSDSHKGYVMPEEQKKKIRQAQIKSGNKPKIKKGKDHYNWQGGITKTYYQRNKEKSRTASKRWAQNNLEKVNFLSKQYYRRKKGAIGTHTFGEWELLKKQYGYTCPSCIKCEPEIKLEADHIIPLTKGGSNLIENIQPLCRSCNASKNTKIKKYDTLHN